MLDDDLERPKNFSKGSSTPKTGQLMHLVFRAFLNASRVPFVSAPSVRPKLIYIYGSQVRHQHLYFSTLGGSNPFFIVRCFASMIMEEHLPHSGQAASKSHVGTLMPFKSMSKMAKSELLQTTHYSTKSGNWTVSDYSEKMTKSDQSESEEDQKMYENKPKELEVVEDVEPVMCPGPGRKLKSNATLLSEDKRHRRERSKRKYTVAENIIRSVENLKRNEGERNSSPEAPCLMNPAVTEFETNHRTVNGHSNNGENSPEEKELKSLVQEMQNLRKWEYTGLGQAIKEEGSKEHDYFFTIMSYNILSQDLLNAHLSLYSSCDPYTLKWEYRKEGLLREIQFFNCDILCFQEVQHDQYESCLIPELNNLGYEGRYKRKTGNHTDGCATFWKRNKFTLLDMSSVEFYQPDVKMLNRDNVALIFKLKFKGFHQENPRHRWRHHPEEICVANTHLLYNPNRPDIKLAQLQLLFAEIDRMAFAEFLHDGKPRYLPVLLCGDLNFQPHTPIYYFVTKGQIQFEGSCNRTLNKYGMGHALDRHLIPPHLQIACAKQVLDFWNKVKCSNKHAIKAFFQVDDWCQHHFIQEERKMGCKNSSGLVHVYHSEKNPCTKNSGVPAQLGEMVTTHDHPQKLFGSGWLFHQFGLKSVYSHRLPRAGGAPEITTRHKDWASVDYIFYGTSWSEKYNKRVEGSLKLVGRYGLLSPLECRKFGEMPNLVSPSDHYPLIAEFVMKR